MSPIAVPESSSFSYKICLVGWWHGFQISKHYLNASFRGSLCIHNDSKVWTSISSPTYVWLMIKKKLMCMSVDLFPLIQNSFWSTMHTSDFRASLHCRVIFSQFWFQTYCRIARWGFIGTDNQYCLWGTSWWYLTVSAWEDTKWISSREIYCFSSNWCCWPLSAYTKCWFCGFAI